MRPFASNREPDSGDGLPKIRRQEPSSCDPRWESCVPAEAESESELRMPLGRVARHAANARRRRSQYRHPLGLLGALDARRRAPPQERPQAYLFPLCSQARGSPICKLRSGCTSGGGLMRARTRSQPRRSDTRRQAWTVRDQDERTGDVPWRPPFCSSWSDESTVSRGYASVTSGRSTSSRSVPAIRPCWRRYAWTPLPTKRGSVKCGRLRWQPENTPARTRCSLRRTRPRHSGRCRPRSNGCLPRNGYSGNPGRGRFSVLSYSVQGTGVFNSYSARHHLEPSHTRTATVLRSAIFALLVVGVTGGAVCARPLTSVVVADSLSRFPRVEGSNLGGEHFALPSDFKGELNVVLVAFSREQQADVDSWMPLLKTVRESPRALRVYELPTLGRRYRLMRPFIDGGMRRGHSGRRRA